MSNYDELREICSTMARWLHQPPSDPGWPPGRWRLLQRASLVHGVGPALDVRLTDCAWLEPETRHWLGLARELNRARVELLLAEAAAMLGAARRRGVEVMPLKGIALAAHPVGDPALRPMADIDLLVRPRGAQEVAELLLSLGYRQDTVKAKHTSFIRPDNRRVVSRQREHPCNPRPVEVHLRCGETFARRRWDLTERTWQTARTAALGGTPASVPSLGCLWLHLVLHTAWQFLYGGGRLVQLLDLAHLTPRIEDPLATVGDLDARAPYLALSLVERHFPGTVPAAVLAALDGRAGTSVRGLARSLDLLGSSHQSPRSICRLLRLIRLHRSSPRDLGGLVGYVLLPRIGEMHVNHDRVPRGRGRRLAYPVLWLWHVANLTVRS